MTRTGGSWVIVCSALLAPAGLEAQDYGDYSGGSYGGYDPSAYGYGYGYGGDAGDTGDTGGTEPSTWETGTGAVEPGTTGFLATAFAAAAPGEATAGTQVRLADAVYCDGVRYSLEEEREDTGPARLARLHELTRTINVVGRALDPDRCGEAAEGECIGLRKAVERSQYRALELFQGASDLEACMIDPIRMWNEQEGICQEMRQNISDLRKLDREALARAEYVLALRLCDGAMGLDANVRAACTSLATAIAPHAPPSGARPSFWLEAPMPREVQEAIRQVRLITGGNFDVEALNSDLARDYRCETQGQDGSDGTSPTGVLVGLCKEYALLQRVSDSCRQASVYIDERGGIHASGGLSSDDGRTAATLCVDVSDFAPEYPFMVTVRLDDESSRPMRVWPGEPIFIGQYLPGPVDPGDVMGIEVRGKARGISLAETLRVNGVSSDTPDACRIARAYVPVVDHEVPVGGEGQKVIPMSFHTGRLGETGIVTQGDALMIWVRDIEPAGAVRVEYQSGQNPQYVGYVPPPLLGQSAELSQAEQQRQARVPPGAHVRPSEASVDQPLVPRRARYPGSRVLRLGYPSGFFEYPVRVCTYATDRPDWGAGRTAAEGPGIATCGDPRATTVLSEYIYVHGEYYFGIRAALMGSWFPVQRLIPRQTPDALRAGGNAWQVVAESENVFEFDVPLLLAIYPFGRDPYAFDYRFWDLEGGHYWNDVAILLGFSMISIPWDHMYAGLSLPVYSGVSLTVLAHFEKRSIPIGVRAGDIFEFTGSVDPTLGEVFGSESQFITGVAFGVSVDYDLFERAFRAIWAKFGNLPVIRSTPYGG
ncbi:MAG: hypothetical protein HY825_02270 [Acidobacteria bacterium]|nr:hypothetical protein [Acidobacteriota bacterium]